MRGSVEFGASGPMQIHELEELVYRNKYRPDVRFIQHGWGLRHGAPSDHCALVVGNADRGDALAVPTPVIPERTVIDEATGRIQARGWRALLKILIGQRTIRPSREVLLALGYSDFDKAKENLGCT